MAKEKNVGTEEVTAKPLADEPVKKDSVTVSKETLASLVERLDKLEEEKKRDQEKIAMLESTADVGRIAQWEERNKGKLVSKARVCILEGKPVIGWKTVKDEVHYSPSGAMVVNQVIKIFTLTEDDKTEETDLDYIRWVRAVKSEQGEVVKKSETLDGSEYTIRLPSGRQITMDVRFLNAF
jgi:hypothetical protein